MVCCSLILIVFVLLLVLDPTELEFERDYDNAHYCIGRGLSGS